MSVHLDASPPTVGPIFVCRATLAARFECSVDTVDQWVRDGFLPPPHLVRGQIQRWHWPTIEARLAGRRGKRDDATDDYMTGVNRAKGNARESS